MRTILEVRFHVEAEFWIHFFIEIVRDVPPDFLAVDFDRLVDHDVYGSPIFR
jgi:hypothetical protein